MLPLCPHIQVPEADLARIRDLYERGCLLQAYAVGQAYGLPANWAGTQARVLAARLAMNLGAPRLGRRLSLRAYLRDPTDPEARFYYIFVLLEMRGPVAAWDALGRFGDMPDAPGQTRADLFGLRCRAAALVRDFDTAEHWLRRAEQLAPGRAWLRVERSFVLEQQDRYQEAYDAACEAMRLHPHPYYRPAAQAAAHLLELLDRDAEAIELLTAAGTGLENGPIMIQLAALQGELGLYDEARKSLDRYVELSPLLEPDLVDWIAGQRAKLLYLSGRRAEAASIARTLQDPFYQRFAEALLEPEGRHKRVILPVHFLRQHHKTCAPATLATIGRYWKMPSDHLQLAEAICYDGTPSFKQREWAETNGWVVREFRLTWESAVALLDRGVPFTVATVETMTSHLQAVIGYDSLRRSLWIRDPYERHAGEALVEPFLNRYRSSGPKAMALVPLEHRELLDSLDLPDAGLYDDYYRLQRALSLHRRQEAQEALSGLVSAVPDHPLCFQARRELAVYDGNAAETLCSIEDLLRLFPDNANFRLAKLAALRDAPREERLKFLQSICSEKEVDPIFWQQYARELSLDGRERAQAERLLRRSLRFRPVDAMSFAILGDLLWNDRRFAEALLLYRFAASLEDKNEDAARTYFIAARHLRQTETALTHLQTRFQRLGRFACGPATTLVWACEALDRAADAFQWLESALELRPSDGELLCFAADEHARWAKIDRAESLLAAAAGKCHPSVWLRTKARIAQYQGEPGRELALWRQLLELEPLSIQVHSEVARLLAATDGTAAALRHLEQACDRFPNHFGIHRLWIEWLRGEPAEAAEPAIRRLLNINPADAWTRRELAGCLTRRKRFDEALAEANRALEIDPQSVSSYNVRAQVLASAGRPEAAREDFRRAIELAVDNEFAIRRLVELAGTHAQRKLDLQFVEGELIRQVVYGDGLLAFRDVAHPILPPEELLNSLQFALKERPDLWHAWAALIQQSTDMGRLDLALLRAQEATLRFPLVPRLWLEMARVQFARADRAQEAAALRKALEISPGWSLAARGLADVFEYQGSFAHAREVIELAVARDPLDEFNHGYLASILWKLGEREAALGRLQTALRLNGGYDWAWEALSQWGRELGRPDLAVDAARTLVAERAGEANSWFRLAKALREPEHLEERIAALGRAIEIQPHFVQAHQLRAELLAEAGNFDEALSACSSAEGDGAIPVQLRATAAGVQAARGNLPEAIRLIREVAASDPDYYPAWSRLADWCLQNGDWQEAAAAITEMIRLAPLNAVPVASLGELRAKEGKRVEAKRHFRRALELDPEYPYPGFMLFDLHFEDDELEPAAEALTALRLPPGNPFHSVRELQLAARRGERERSLEILSGLCGAKGDAAWPIQTGVDAVVRAGWEAEADQCLEDWLESPDSNPQVGAVWVRRRTGQGRWNIWKRFESLCERGATGREAVLQFLDSLGDAGVEALQRRSHFRLTRLRWVFRRFLRKHRRRLETDVMAWGKTGRVLIGLGKQREAVSWMSSWRRQPRVEMWMLYNLALVLRALGKERQSVDVIRAALRLPVRDATFEGLSVWAALEEALAGETAAARAALTSVEQAKLDDERRMLLAMARAVLEVQEAPAADRLRIVRTSVADARAAMAGNPEAKTKEMRRIWRRCLRRMQKDAPCFWIGWQRSWAFQRELGWGFAVLALIVLLTLGSAVTGMGMALLLPVWFFALLYRFWPRGRG